MIEVYTPFKRSAEAEAATLGGILLAGDEALDVAITMLVPEDFATPSFGAVFGAMIRLRELGEPIDTITLETQLRRQGQLELVGGIEGLARLDRYATAHNIRAHIEILLQASQMRRQLEWHQQQAEALRKREDLADAHEWSEFSAKARVTFAELSSAGARGVELHTAEHVVEQFMSDIEDRAYGRIAVASLGIVPLDEACSPQQGDIAVIMGRPGMGKTAVSLSMTVGLTMEPHHDWLRVRANASPVLWASAEMPAIKLIGRLASSVATLEGRMITRPDVFGFESIRRRLAAAGRLISEAPITFVPNRDAKNLTSIIAAARKWRATLPEHVPSHEGDQAGVPVLFIDYLQILQISGSFGREDLKYAHAARLLAELAIELSIVIVVCAQLIKSVAGRDQARPRLGDIKEASGLEDAAHHVISVYRPAVALNKIGELMEVVKRLSRQRSLLEHRGQSLEHEAEVELSAAEDALSEAYLDVLKARNGELGSHPMLFEGRYTRVTAP